MGPQATDRKRGHRRTIPEADRDGVEPGCQSNRAGISRTHGGLLLHEGARGLVRHDRDRGSNDIQALADIGNSFAIIRTIRLAPFTKQDILQVAVATVAPIAPLILTMIPLEELLKKLFGVLL
jgi:hypothetical protein